MNEAMLEAATASKVLGVGVTDAIARAQDGIANVPVGNGEGKSWTLSQWGVDA